MLKLLKALQNINPVKQLIVELKMVQNLKIHPKLFNKVQGTSYNYLLVDELLSLE